MSKQMELLQEKIDELTRRVGIDSEAKLKRMVDENFRTLYGHLSEIGYVGYSDIFGVTGDSAARRKEVILKYIPAAREKYASLPLHSVEETFIYFHTFVIHNYCHLNDDHDLMIGAALWILDDLRINGKLLEADKLMTDSYADLEVADCPLGLNHPFYSQELIRAVMRILIMRNDDPSDPFQDVQTANNIVPKTKNRENFDTLMSLLTPERVESACNEFISLQEEIEERYMKAIAVYDEKEAFIGEEFRQLVSSYAGNAPALLAKEWNPFDDQDILNKMDDIALEKQHFKASVSDFIAFQYADVRKEVSIKKVAKIISDFRVDDPYAVCFALVYLLATGRDEPWLNGSGCLLMRTAGAELPWCQESEEYYWDEDDLTLFYNDWDKKPLKVTEGLFRNRIQNSLNIPQLIYKMTGSVIPSSLHPFAKERQDLIEEGIDEHTADKIISVAEILFLQQFPQEHIRLSDLDDIDFSFPLGKQEPSQSAETPEEVSDDLPDTEDHTADLEKYKKENKELKRLLGEISKEHREEKKKTEAELEILRREHRELADLRALVFNREQQEKETVSAGITFPYETKKRMVVFGGHDAFLKGIKPLLPSVRFVDVEDLTFDPNIVRNADMVWVQTNYMSHSQYGMIVNITRKYGIQLRYFAFASAVKCAEQVVKEDKK